MSDENPPQAQVVVGHPWCTDSIPSDDVALVELRHGVDRGIALHDIDDRYDSRIVVALVNVLGGVIPAA